MREAFSVIINEEAFGTAAIVPEALNCPKED
jgi:hypothetical protein